MVMVMVVVVVVVMVVVVVVEVKKDGGYEFDLWKRGALCSGTCFQQ